MQEKPGQSLESQLKMARPKRSEVKRVPLTPEEKEFLGKIMEKAVAAEKAGKLKEALDFYIDYKNELSKIKEKKEEDKKKEEVWDFDRMVDWVENQIGVEEFDPASWAASVFDLSNPPNIITAGALHLENSNIVELPPNLIVNGYLDLTGCSKLKILPKDLIVSEDIYVYGCEKKVVEKAERLRAEGKIKGRVITKEPE